MRTAGSWAVGLWRRLLAFHMSHPGAALAVWLSLAVLSMAYAYFCLKFEPSQKALISQHNRLIQRLRVADRFSQLDAFIVAVENRDTPRSIAFANALAGRLKADQKHFAQVFYRIEPGSLRPWALRYLSEKDLHSLVGALREHREFLSRVSASPGLSTFLEAINDEIASRMVGELFTGFLSGGARPDKAASLDLSFLVRTLGDTQSATEGSFAFASPLARLFDTGMTNSSNEGYFFTEGKKYLLISVTPTGLSKNQEEKQALQALRENIRGLKKQFPDIDAGVTGEKALDQAEMTMATRDVGVATALSIAALALLLLIFWRSVKRPMMEMIVLAISLCLTLGLATLTIGHLNLLSVTFAPMLLGLGINYGIHWFARYEEERTHSRVPVRAVLRSTMDKVGGAILLAGLCAALSFLPLVLTWFKGLSELGIICGMGMAVTTVATLCLLPVLITLMDRFNIGAGRRFIPEEVRPLFATGKARSVFLLGFAAASGGLCLWAAAHTGFDLNMLHLQSQNAEPVIWEKKLIGASGYASIYGVLFAHSFAEIDEKTSALKRLPTVSRVTSIKDMLPPDQERKARIIGEMKPILGDLRPIPVPAGPVDLKRLDDVLSRIAFKMAGRPEIPAGSHIGRQMAEVRSLIDTIRRQMASVPRAVLLDRLKRLEVTITQRPQRYDLAGPGEHRSGADGDQGAAAASSGQVRGQ